MERAAGTFHDRLVTELRLAGATTIAQANQVMEQFIPRFNLRFGVPPELLDAAYRLLDPAVNLAGILCFKHSRKVAKDNTVKYNRRTLQLLPGEDRPSYAGAKVEVLELPSGSIRTRPFLPGRHREVRGLYVPTVALWSQRRTSDGS